MDIIFVATKIALNKNKANDDFEYKLQIVQPKKVITMRLKPHHYNFLKFVKTCCLLFYNLNSLHFRI